MPGYKRLIILRLPCELSIIRPRVPTPWRLFLNLRVLKAWDSSKTLGLSQKLWTDKDCPKDPVSQHNWGNFLISKTQKAWDSLRTLGLSQKPETVPDHLGLSQRPRVPTPWSLFLNFRDPNPGIVPGL